MQKSSIRDYLNSMKLSGNNQPNAMSAKKTKARDLECLLDESEDEELSGNQTGTSGSFAAHSTPSTSRMSNQQTRRTIDSDDKRAIRKALTHAKHKDSREEQWPNDKSSNPVATDYLMAGSSSTNSFDQEQPSTSTKFK